MHFSTWAGELILRQLFTSETGTNMTLSSTNMVLTIELFSARVLARPTKISTFDFNLVLSAIARNFLSLLTGRAISWVTWFFA
jgi:hypothetical protein